MTKGQIIDDILLRLYGGKPSDDSEIDERQINAWLDQVNGQMLSQYIYKRNGGRVPSSCLTLYSCEGISIDKPECYGGCVSYTYIDLPVDDSGVPVSILSLPEDKGVASVLQGNKPIYRLESPTKVRMAMKKRFGDKDKYFSRIGDRILLFGQFPSYSKFEVMVVLGDTSSLSMDTRYPTVEEMLPSIMDEVTKIGLSELQSVVDIQNDGV